jgi:murein DD-endopeptidase MepM/ murein hydrolase activator NlpD
MGTPTESNASVTDESMEGGATSRRIRAVRALIRRAGIRRERRSWHFVNAGLAAAILAGSGLAATSGEHAEAQAAEQQNDTVVQADWHVDTVLADMSEAAAKKAAADKAAKEKAAEAAAEKARLAALPWTLPSDARVTSKFGMRDGRLHGGTDFGEFEGEDIWAAGDGVVSYVGYEEGGYGNVVFIDHPDGTQTRYGHASKILVEEGDKVSKGDVIMLAGDTGRSNGPHLHFEVLIDGEKVDSLKWLEQQGLNPG